MSNHCAESVTWKWKQLVLIITLALILLPLGCVEIDESTAVVTKVIDGDTIEIEGGYRVRYIGIDAPERGEPYYWEAYQSNRELVLGKRVHLERDVEDKDKYGRLLRYVWINDTMVNAELVRLGYAYSRPYPPNLKYQAYLQQMEEKAKEHRLGVWSSCLTKQTQSLFLRLCVAGQF